VSCFPQPPKNNDILNGCGFLRTGPLPLLHESNTARIRPCASSTSEFHAGCGSKTAARNHAGTLFFFPTLKWPRVEDGYYTNAVTSNKSCFVFFILYAALVFST
jgi:hypothetical protein